MSANFADEGPDLSQIYRASNVATAPNAADDLFRLLATYSQSQVATPAGTPPVKVEASTATPTSKDATPATSAPTTGAPAPAAGATAAPTTAAPSPKPDGTAPAATAPAPNPTGGPADPAGQALLARLAPKGITSLDQLKGKTDIELRDLSAGVIAYEEQQTALNKYFLRNPDGTYDFTRKPDGSPSGLDAGGRVLPPTPAAGTPAPAPAAGAPGTGAKPAAKKPTSAELAAIKARSVKAGKNPTSAQVMATWTRNQARITQPPRA